MLSPLAFFTINAPALDKNKRNENLSEWMNNRGARILGFRPPIVIPIPVDFIKIYVRFEVRQQEEETRKAFLQNARSSLLVWKLKKIAAKTSPEK
jgi:hypothetical protein